MKLMSKVAVGILVVLLVGAAGTLCQPLPAPGSLATHAFNPDRQHPNTGGRANAHNKHTSGAGAGTGDGSAVCFQARQALRDVSGMMDSSESISSAAHHQQHSPQPSFSNLQALRLVVRRLCEDEEKDTGEVVSPSPPSPSSSSSSSSPSPSSPGHRQRRSDVSAHSTIATATTTAHAAATPTTGWVQPVDPPRLTPPEFPCTIFLILAGLCRLSTPLGPGRPLAIIFDVRNPEPATETLTPTSVSVAMLRVLADTYKPTELSLRGAVYDEDLEWVVNNANWTSVTAVTIRGIVSTTFRTRSLAALHNLRSLDISHNHLYNIDSSPDPTTSSTAMPPAAAAINSNAANAAVDAAGAVALPLLEVLDARNNSLVYIPPAIFTGLPRLRTANLTQNFIRTVPASAFEQAPLLEGLGMRNNRITAIHPRAFAPLSLLQLLDLDFNQLRTLHASTFASQQHLMFLYMHENELTALPKGLFAANTQLGHLTLDGNPLQTIPATLFQNTRRLNRVTMFNTRLTALPRGLLRNLRQLVYFTVSGNRITSLDADAFHGLTRLTDLYLNRLELTSLPQGVFAPLTRLVNLGLGRNKLTSLPHDLLDSNAKLRLLTLSFNRLTTLPATLFLNKPHLSAVYLQTNQLSRIPLQGAMLSNLTVLDLNRNPLRALPDFLSTPHLETLRMRDHAMTEVDALPVLSLRGLRSIELSARAAPGSAGARMLFDLSLARRHNVTAPPHMVELDLSNIALPPAFVAFAIGQRLQLQRVLMGWPGMNEVTAPLHTLCLLLADDVQEVGIFNSGYQRIKLCPRHRFHTLSLQDNRDLVELEAVHAVHSLNVSGCTSLRSMNVLSVNVLDISQTQLPFRPPLCTAWGSTMLVAQRVRRSEAVSLTDIGALISVCLANLLLLDISDNNWLKRIELVETSPIVVSEREFWSEDMADDLQSSSDIPILLINQGSVDCTLHLGAAEVRDKAAPSSITNELTYDFRCRCSPRFVQRGGDCVPDRLSSGAIAGLVLAGTALSLLGLAFMYRRFRRRRQGLEMENELNRQLLSEKEEEVLALKKAWEIEFDELTLMQRIDTGSEGASGEVWSAQWETLTVAVKILRESVSLFDPTTVFEFEKEVEFLQRTRHPHVVRFFGAGTDPTGSPFLVLEYVALGSLKQLLARDLEDVVEEYRTYALRPQAMAKPFPYSHQQQQQRDKGEGRRRPKQGRSLRRAPSRVWDLKVRLMQDVANGMAFIHSLGQMHRDLKSGNVLVTPHLRAKITDFGSIRRVLGKPTTTTSDSICVTTNTMTRETRSSSLLHVTSDVPYSQQLSGKTVHLDMTAAIGTPMYMAPEVLGEGRYGSKADVFSFGVLLWEVATQRVPDLVEQELGGQYVGPMLDTMLQLLVAGKRLRFPPRQEQDVPEWYTALAANCVQHRPETRPLFTLIQRVLARHRSFKAPAEAAAKQKQQLTCVQGKDEEEAAEGREEVGDHSAAAAAAHDADLDDIDDHKDTRQLGSSTTA